MNAINAYFILMIPPVLGGLLGLAVCWQKWGFPGSPYNGSKAAR